MFFPEVFFCFALRMQVSAFYSYTAIQRKELVRNRNIFNIYYAGHEALEQDAQTSYGCPIPASVQGQVEWGFEQHVVVADLPAYGRGIGTR